MGTPAALVFIAGAALLFIGARGLDRKHGIIGHRLG